MDKEQIMQELRFAYKEREYKYGMLNYADKDFIDVVAFEIKALDCKIKALKKRLSESGQAQVKKDDSFWNAYILNCMNVPIGVKKETVCRQTNTVSM